METITPLMRAIMDALDTADDGLTDGEIRAAIDRLFSDDDLATALYDLFYVLDLTAQHIIVDDLTDEASTLHPLTDAGCDALWALQKADAVSATFVGVDTASGPDKGIRVTFANGAMIDFVDTNHAPLTGYPNPVRDHDAHNPARDDNLLWQPGQPRVDDGVRPVRFNSRDELREYVGVAL